jgi:uncharacterized OB-fold protein
MSEATERAIPAPIPTEDTLAFWNAAKEGRFLVKRCLDCGDAHWYPRALCPYCFSDRTEWQPGSGRGTVYSYTVMRRAPQPYALAFVTLAEGPTMLTNLVDCDFDALAIGQAVQLVFKPSTGAWPVPVFKPLTEPAVPTPNQAEAT